MTFLDTFVQLSVIFGFGIWAYSKIKKQSIMETFAEIKDLVQGIKESG